MKPHYLLIAAITSLTACTYSGFNPPIQTNHWFLSEKVHPNRTFEEFRKIEKRDRRACGLDPHSTGAGGKAHAALCLESKGWYNTAGPACERDIYKNQKACIEWRAKRGQ